MKTIIAANWKMHKTRPQAAETAAELALALAGGTPEKREAIVFPPYTDIAAVADAFAGLKNVHCGAQNFYPAEQGAFTGEISPAMIKECGATWALTGHSERRHIFRENDEIIEKKTSFGLQQGLCIMLCIGETLEEREAGKLAEVLQRQIKTALVGLAAQPEMLARLCIAYEPVWAIGTGKVAGEKEILDAHAQTRTLLCDLLGAQQGNEMPILYGGSVKPANAGSILKLDNVNGLLVGGASLEAASFLDILRA